MLDAGGNLDCSLVPVVIFNRNLSYTIGELYSNLCQQKPLTPLFNLEQATSRQAFLLLCNACDAD